MICLKKLLPALFLCSLVVVGCGTVKKQPAKTAPTTQERVEKKANDLADLKGAAVESVSLDGGTIALKVTFDSGILFGFNKTDLGEEAKSSLEALLAEIKDMPDAHIRVYGHTDIVGSAEVNQKVSEERARKVAAFLVDNGISASRIEAEGMSFNNPVADNSTEEGRAKNRRVEIFVIPAQ